MRGRERTREEGRRGSERGGEEEGGRGQGWLYGLNFKFLIKISYVVLYELYIILSSTIYIRVCNFT